MTPAPLAPLASGEGVGEIGSLFLDSNKNTAIALVNNKLALRILPSGITYQDTPTNTNDPMSNISRIIYDLWE
jgi:hypothetical protein